MKSIQIETGSSYVIGEAFYADILCEEFCKVTYNSYQGRIPSHSYIGDSLELSRLERQCLLLEWKQVLACCLSVILDSIVVSIPACHAGDRGSIPRRGDNLFDLPLIAYNSHITTVSYLIKRADG